MKIFTKKNLITAFFSFLTGLANGLLGAGGGMITVPLLKKMGLSQSKAQANAIAVILPLTLLSTAVYLFRGNLTISDALPYIPGGLIGAYLGTKLLKKISDKTLKKIFAAFMLYAGIRLLFK